jgi:murein DD-endopeptidase MepM/ murein hydrolase activator NlpD
MATFPFAHRPKESYKERPRAFGAPRSNGTRKHAGCDLYATPGTEVLAIEDGTVVRGPYLFYDVVYAIEVQHTSGLFRYGEISHAPEGIKPGATVKAGQVIGFVGKMLSVPASMLHLEMYTGKGSGPLTARDHQPYLRRADLVDPTAFLDACTLFAPPATA